MFEWLLCFFNRIIIKKSVIVFLYNEAFHPKYFKLDNVIVVFFSKNILCIQSLNKGIKHYYKPATGSFYDATFLES